MQTANPNRHNVSKRLRWFFIGIFLPALSIAAVVVAIRINAENHLQAAVSGPPDSKAQAEQSNEAQAPGGADTAAAIVPAAEALIAALDDKRRKQLLFPFDDAAQRKKWSNLPAGIFQRNGIRMGDISEERLAAVWKLLGALLSPEGLEKVKGIVDSDEALRLGSRRRGRIAFGKDEFYLAFLGKPSHAEPWMVQFGGHHLAVNVVMKGKAGVITPSLIAVQPASFIRNGKTVRPMADEIDKALALMQSLNAAQREAATLGSQFRDLVLGAGEDGRTIAPEGVKASTFSAAQRERLLDLIGEWARIIHPAAAAARMREISGRLEETWFAWSGPVAEGRAAYFRIQGPTLHIELAPQRLGGDPMNHIHSIYRNPANDYGAKLWQ